MQIGFLSNCDPASHLLGLWPRAPRTRVQATSNIRPLSHHVSPRCRLCRPWLRLGWLQPYNPFLFCRIGTRADANIHKEFASRYPSNGIRTVVEQWIHGYLCLVCFSSSTHFCLVRGLAWKVWRQCVLVFAHDLGLRGGNFNGLLAGTGLCVSTGNRYLFLLFRQILLSTPDHGS